MKLKSIALAAAAAAVAVSSLLAAPAHPGKPWATRRGERPALPFSVKHVSVKD